jgi:hypothetical protein
VSTLTPHFLHTQNDCGYAKIDRIRRASRLRQAGNVTTVTFIAQAQQHGWRSVGRAGERRCADEKGRARLHTGAALVHVVVARVERDPPDFGPCVIATKIIEGGADYMQWVVHETAAVHAARVGR